MRKSVTILEYSLTCFGTCRLRQRYVRKQIVKNSRRLKVYWTYTAGELAKILVVHRQTLGQWRSEGLAPITTEIKPWLYNGGHVRDFIRQRSAKRKAKLGPGEFYCFRCKVPRRSRSGMTAALEWVGLAEESYKAVRMTGECEVCGCRMHRMGFSREGTAPVDSNRGTRD